MAVNRDKFSEPSPRQGHVSALVDAKVCVWGDTNTEGTKDANHCYHFDPLLESWSQSDCIGPTPGLQYAACASAGHHLYTYGGRDVGDGCYSSLHQLDLRTNTWRMISLSAHDWPRRKIACGLVHVSSHLLLIGGEDEDRQDTDEIHMFDLNEGEKEGAMCYGHPLPLSGD